MIKLTKKELKHFVENGGVVDITSWASDSIRQLQRTRSLKSIFYCAGLYGITGVILQDEKTDKMYACTSRNSVLFQVM